MSLLVSLGLHGAALAVVVTRWTPVPPQAEPPALAVEWVRLPSAAPPVAAPAKIRSKPVVTRRAAAIAPSPIPPSPVSTTEAADAVQPSTSVDGSASAGVEQGGVASGPAVTFPGYRLGDAHTPAPDYPWSARRRGVEGRVVVRLRVDAQGNPMFAELVHSSGDSALDRAALQTLRHWRLRPATLDGLPVDGQVVVPILFKLT